MNRMMYDADSARMSTTSPIGIWGFGLAEPGYMMADATKIL